jgi:hypothetical protein
MILERKRKKILVRDGTINYHIGISNQGIACPCGKELCAHLRLLFDALKINRTLLEQHYPHLQRELARLYLENPAQDFNPRLKQHLRRQYGEDCGLCLAPLYRQPFDVGVCCGKGIHLSCHQKWAARDRRCIYCRQVPGPDGEGILSGTT